MTKIIIDIEDGSNKIGSIESIKVNPNEVLVVKIDRSNMPTNNFKEYTIQIKEALQETFPNTKLFICELSTVITKIEATDTDNAT